MKLVNRRWETFCLEYAKDPNATKAYKIAGYKCKNDASANSAALRLLQNVKIQARLSELHEEMKSEKIASATEIQERLTSILRMEMQEEVVVVEGIEKGVSEARIVKKRPSNSDAIKAGQTLAKMQGAWEKNVNVNVVVPKFGGEDDLED